VVEVIIVTWMRALRFPVEEIFHGCEHGEC
jgi:hypothetical protein